MPALQIRDLPNDLYESLKLCAERDRRSLAQEAAVAIESYVAQQGGAVSETAHMRLIPGDPVAEPASRRRIAAFGRIKSRGCLRLPSEFEDAADLVRLVRGVRDCQLEHDREGGR